jgi:hypothetical protein
MGNRVGGLNSWLDLAALGSDLFTGGVFGVTVSSIIPKSYYNKVKENEGSLKEHRLG